MPIDSDPRDIGRAYWTGVAQEDGAQAWTRPVYLTLEP